MRVAIVADDLTGAMDTAAPFAMNGFRTRVIPLSAAIASSSLDDVDVVAVNTETRHCPPDVARDVVRACLSTLIQGRPEFIFKKIDSTLRGNVAAEISETLVRSGRRGAIVTPAMPSQGRTLKNGMLFIWEAPLSLTAIGRDALTPPPRAPLIEELRRGASDLEWRPATVGTETAFAPGCGFVYDAETAEDLAAIARIAIRFAGNVLISGSGGLGDALAKELGGTVIPTCRPVKLTGPLVFVVGSRTPQATEQVETLTESERNFAVVAASDGDVTPTVLADIVSKKPDVILVLPPKKKSDAAAVAVHLGKTARQIVEATSAEGIVMTGGDTALAVLRALKVSTIDVLGEIVPGIALGRTQILDREISTVTKAGGFGDSSIFAVIRDHLRHG